ncbi:MAG: tRNA (guanosine(37)-N1)-methyltransferase TrmD [Salibacteraceae bacterium]|jgi:tRNA (guanine37-N1)-methyltransferase|nr:tRNA (guanosine(37)-N1)-methyltransferase TrmD [Salibacteraceae bacterium]MDP4687195.1 tRNA (guanosine(37)-N1)-methyltransferase TrmD [Salibacteraceae bacterium]MDP4763350.1 tRNA (guanosine(37)-N1)-methyltransferase TrmD [Salibacteraceae bacterium]MDP4844272.1 tRNA (guanosine(37)-N1)-methyltransferase TrmD [Salibacteraceae bacterium]MDP4964443.1 tRNA (guanosine(37)-N1)-methyltransferase TrmD [Salibacteraceae bacterium]
MRIDIITLMPALLDGPFAHSIVKRAQERGLAEVHVHDLRNYGLGKHKQVDDTQFGGGAGMVMMIEPIERIINELKSKNEYDEVIFMTPDGEQFKQSIANNLSLKTNLILLCGHYKGIDERIRTQFITKEVSIGDYVLSGGELAAAVVTDAVIRLIPGVLNDETSALSDSFQDDLLAPPVYTRPAEYRGWTVPEVLLSGNFKAIDKWRQEQAESRTKSRRPDIWNKKDSSEG